MPPRRDTPGPVDARDVFVNCPFDERYRPILHAIVYTVVRSGYRVRCALETDDGSENRLARICAIVAQCRYGIHDLSRTDAEGDPPLPRFNMPLELGLFLGAKRFGSRHQKAKVALILDRERFRFQRFISDLAGQDIRAHGDRVSDVIREVAAWLRRQPDGTPVGGQALVDEYAAFLDVLPDICRRLRMEPAELEFGDFNAIVRGYVADLAATPAP